MYFNNFNPEFKPVLRNGQYLEIEIIKQVPSLNDLIFLGSLDNILATPKMQALSLKDSTYLDEAIKHTSY